MTVRQQIYLAPNGGELIHTFTPPAGGITAGQHIGIFAATGNGDRTFTTPDGFTPTEFETDWGNGEGSLAFFRKIAAGGEANIDVEVDASTKVVGFYVVSDEAFDVSAIGTPTGASTSLVSPLVTTAQNNCEVLSFIGADTSGASGATQPAGMSLLDSGASGAGSKVSCALAQVTQATAGSSGTKTWGLTGTETGLGITVSLLPASSVNDLTAGTATSITGRSATIGCSTTVGAGTIYGVLSTSATAPTETQIVAGQDHTGSAAADGVSIVVSATGAQTVGATGLPLDTTLYPHWVHDEDDGGTYSNVFSPASIATLNAGITSPAIEDYASVAITSVSSLTVVFYDSLGGTELAQVSDGAIDGSGIFTYAAPSTQDIGDTGFGIIDLTGNEFMPFSYTIIDRDA